MYIYRFFCIFFSGMAYYRILNVVSYDTQQDLVFMYSVYTSLHLPVPNSQSIPPPAFHLGNHRSVLYAYVSAASISSFVSYFIFHIQAIYQSHSSVQLFATPWTVAHHASQPAMFLCPWNSLGKNTGMGSHSLLQEIFPTQGSNLGLPHCRQILHCV